MRIDVARRHTRHISGGSGVRARLDHRRVYSDERRGELAHEQVLVVRVDLALENGDGGRLSIEDGRRWRRQAVIHANWLLDFAVANRRRDRVRLRLGVGCYCGCIICGVIGRFCVRLDAGRS